MVTALFGLLLAVGKLDELEIAAVWSYFLSLLALLSRVSM